MLKKQVFIVVTIMALIFTLAGCAKKPTTPVTPQTGTEVTPSDHPTETPANSGNKVSQTDVEGKINDLLNKKYPADWKVSGTTLSKGAYTENGNYKIVDDVAALFPETMGVSIFIGEERISSSVIQQDTGTRVLKGYATPPTVGEVMKSGKTTSTLSSGYLKVYVPFKDSSSKTVAVMTVSVPQQ
ncbi:cache domain-containing protein [Desulfosporosinus sp. OT]|uniref:cache domain-containing protein n=1 Tax=Desulfosporosinus sp. OT TaxID=913865 RepID=UPI0002239AED|nr:cache domain-containing protein [Desulfosporosinus sp. OT]EGW41044.1 putative lipoprotein [Desulfosporosinus sp. OT]